MRIVGAVATPALGVTPAYPGGMHDDINRVLRTLDDREQTVVRLRYGLDDGRPRTLDEIGRHFGISRERVRQIERDSMAKLRVGDRSEVLRSYAS